MPPIAPQCEPHWNGGFVAKSDPRTGIEWRLTQLAAIIAAGRDCSLQSPHFLRPWKSGAAPTKKGIRLAGDGILELVVAGPDDNNHYRPCSCSGVSRSTAALTIGTAVTFSGCCATRLRAPASPASFYRSLNIHDGKISGGMQRPPALAATM